MQAWIRNYLLEFGAAAVCSVAGFWAVGLSHDLLSDLGMNWDFGGCISSLLAGLFIGCPFGSLLGILLVERLIAKSRQWNMTGIVLGLFLSPVGVFIGAYAADQLGPIMFYGWPLIVSVGVCIGYRLGALYNSATKR